MNENGDDGKRDDINAKEIVRHHQRYQNGEDGDERVEHRDTSNIFEVIAME